MALDGVVSSIPKCREKHNVFRLMTKNIMKNTDETTFLKFTINRRINISVKYLSDSTWKVPQKGSYSTSRQVCIHLTMTENKDLELSTLPLASHSGYEPVVQKL